MSHIIMDFDLCDIFIEEMQKLQFRQQSIEQVKSSKYFKQAIGLEPTMQKANLVLLVNSIFLTGPTVVPYQIRLGLTMAADTIAWTSDLKILLIPFLKENEDIFFPTAI